MPVEYPKEFPAVELSLLIRKLRGQPAIETAEAIHASWVVCGYACNFIAPNEQPRIIGFEAGAPLSEGNLNEIDLLDLLLTNGNNTVLSQGLNWALIAKLATKLFMLFLMERRPNA